MNATQLFEREHIRSITRNPDHWQGSRYVVWLRCGGYSGCGDTIEQALADAKAKNAEWLDEAA